MRLNKRLNEEITLPSSFPLIAPMGPMGSKPVSNPNLPTNTDDEPALPDDGPPPGSVPVSDPALEPYDLDGDGFLSPDELIKAIDDNPDFIFILLRIDGMPVSLTPSLPLKFPILSNLCGVPFVFFCLSENALYKSFI